MPELKKLLFKALIFVFLLPVFTLSGCGGSYSGGAGSTYSINGTVTETSPLSNATVYLFSLGSSSPFATAKTDSNGNFTASYSFSSSPDLYAVVRTPSGNTMFSAVVSADSGNPVTLDVNEETAAETSYAVIKSSGTISGSVPYITVADTSLINYMDNALANYPVQIIEVANDLAACVNKEAGCSKITSGMSEYAQGKGQFSINLLKNLMTGIVTPSFAVTMYNSQYREFGLPYAAGSYPMDIAVDSSGNIWVADAGSGTAGTAHGDSNVTELSPDGALIGTFAAGSYPEGIAVDPSGNIWVADAGNGTAGTAPGDSSVTELSPKGVLIGTFAAGSNPWAITADSSGNVWVADRGNWGNGTAGTAPGDSSVTEIPSGSSANTYNPQGYTFVAGSYPVGITADSSGNVWVANYGNGTAGTAAGDSNVTELSPDGALIGTFAAGSYPEGIGVDPSGNIWVTDNGNGTAGTAPGDSSVTEIPSGSSANTYNPQGYTFVAGSYPVGITADSSGNVWVADAGSGTAGTAPGDSSVTEIPSGSSANTYSSSNYTFSAGSNPLGIAVDPSGNIWVTDSGSSSVTELSASGAIIGSTPFTVGIYPWAMAVDSNGNAWVTNWGKGTVTELSSSGIVIGGAPFTVGVRPMGITADSSGNIWVANYGSGTAGTAPGDSSITEIPSGSSANTYTSSNYTFSAGSYPRGITVDPSGNVWVADYGNGTAGTAPGDSSVTELSPQGAIIGTYAAGSYPWVITADSSGNIWVANYGNGTAGTAPGDSSVTELSPQGATIGTFVAGSYPRGIAVDPSGNIWVANYGSGTAGTATGDSSVTEIPSGSSANTYTSSNYTFSAGSYPWGIAVDPSGNVWVADWGNGTAGTAAGDSSVTELSPQGAIIGTFAAGSYPKDISVVDPFGNVWVLNGEGNVTELPGFTMPGITVDGNIIPVMIAQTLISPNIHKPYKPSAKPL